MSSQKPPSYDVALSFAGEDRAYVEQVARCLKAGGARVFYDAYEEASLWGKDLYEHLTDIYQRQAMYTVMFISKAYAQKLWTSHERRSAQARAFEEKREYILPARFDDTEVPGVLRTTGFIDLRVKAPAELCELIFAKLRVPSDPVFDDTPAPADEEPVSATVQLSQDMTKVVCLKFGEELHVVKYAFNFWALNSICYRIWVDEGEVFAGNDAATYDRSQKDWSQRFVRFTLKAAGKLHGLEVKWHMTSSPFVLVPGYLDYFQILVDDKTVYIERR